MSHVFTYLSVNTNQISGHRTLLPDVILVSSKQFTATYLFGNANHWKQFVSGPCWQIWAAWGTDQNVLVRHWSFRRCYKQLFWFQIGNTLYTGVFCCLSILVLSSLVTCFLCFLLSLSSNWTKINSVNNRRYEPNSSKSRKCWVPIKINSSNS